MPKASEHKAGVLKLCKGLPVLIKYNQATECCVTNGAEAKVVDWISYYHPHTKMRTLKTLFVELQNPPTLIQLPGLPLNVVPISPESREVNCEVPDGSIIKINRSQIPVLPNFAMTDYCSQGRTRPFNVVHLNNCTSHQSYYTCLSRSATHEGTFILNGFNSSTITHSEGHALAGNIRQEFRELELLDEISRLKYETMLPQEVDGIVRRDIIAQFRKWKGQNHMPENMHESLRWTKRIPFQLSPCEDAQWKIVTGSNRKPRQEKTTFAVGHKNMSTYVPVQHNQRKCAPTVAIPDNPLLPSSKMHQRRSAESGDQDMTGLIWDSENYSCAYDSLFTLMWNIWKAEKDKTMDQRQMMNNAAFNTLINGFELHSHGELSLEGARDDVRTLLSQRNIQEFPLGAHGVDIKDLIHALFTCADDKSIGDEVTLCDNCGLHDARSISIKSVVYVFCKDNWQLSDMHELPSIIEEGTTEQCALLYFKSMRISAPCTACGHNLLVQKQFDNYPKVLVIHIGDQIMQISHIIKVESHAGPITYRVRGLIYYGSFHFTSTYVDEHNVMWYHDGIQTARRHERTGNMTNANNDTILRIRGRQLCTAIYVLA
ncbi:hypothetical protein SCHPADRAFT_840068 [Schizopora paradoxa]|uniref:Uncharacterized protein n=1 Tax=Schizopora paradoxa TaxID=27342 RepID=A0A0H2R5X9_9AGAM|nr:hypothetical protein SCHPADRAFT_840068 [Schizopora paradoxa]